MLATTQPPSPPNPPHHHTHIAPTPYKRTRANTQVTFMRAHNRAACVVLVWDRLRHASSKSMSEFISKIALIRPLYEHSRAP